MLDFSVVMSVYHGDKPHFVEVAIESITYLQTCQPSEVVIVVDGPVPDDLAAVIKKYDNDNLFNIVWLPENKGLGNALRIGVEKAHNDIIARMDSDDISLPDRFEKQISYLSENPECDVVGSQMAEFIDEESNIVGNRIVPTCNEDIRKGLKSRCTLNHVTVMMRRNKLLSVGNYMDWHYNEDYYLWIRMAEADVNFANLPDTLVNVRVGRDMYRRRGGWRYFKSEEGLQRYMLKRKMIGFPRYVFNVTVRFVIQVAMPNRLRGYVFKKLFRQ